MSNREISDGLTAVITTFNRPEALDRAIRSVLDQTIKPQELLVIDNGDGPKTAKVVGSFLAHGDVSIRFIRETKRGVSCARNKGLQESNFKYVAFLDDDDVWAPDHVEKFFQHSSHYPEFVLYAGRTSRLADLTHTPDKIRPELLSEYEKKEHDQVLVRKKKELQRPFYTPSMSTSIVRKECALSVLFDEELIGREDIYFVWLLGELGDILLHDRSHAYVDQLDVSLFSTQANADAHEKIAMDLKKVKCGVQMMEKIMSKEQRAVHPELRNAMLSAYFDHAYTSSLANDQNTAFMYWKKSARFGLQFRHLKLLSRLILCKLVN